jgi:hypothetical protein
MSDSHDPARLLEAHDAALAELEPLLREARTRGPSAEQAARMRAALGLPAADPTATDDAPHGDAAARTGKPRVEHDASIPTWIKLSLLVALGIGAAFLAQRAVRSPPPDAVATGERPARDVDTRPTESAPAPDSQLQPQADAPLAEPAHAIEPAGSAGTPARRHHAAVAERAVAERGAQPDDVRDPAAELALLKRAKAHARSAPQRALALVAEHEQRFANGSLVQEREVIAIEALLAGGDRDAAERRAARFFERFADSAHARRVRALLGTPPAALSDTKSGVAPHPSGSWTQ